MKCTKLAIAIALATGFAAAPVFAQSAPQYPATGTQQVGYESYEYYAADDSAKSPSDKAPSAVPAAPTAPTAPAAAAAPAAPATSGCGCGCPDACKFSCPDVTTNRLFDDCCWLKCEGISVTGWLEAGYSSNFGPRTGDGFLGPDGFNDRDREVQFNEVYTIIKKAPKTDSCCWDWGYDIDLLYGTDYRYPLARGLDAFSNGDPKWSSDPRNFYGLALPQAYMEAANKELDVKLGHFYTTLGNEVVPATGNVFYSHSYMFLYAYPFTHTGGLATWTPNDQLSLVSGVVQGWDTFFDSGDKANFMTGATFTSSDKHTSLAFNAITGQEQEVGFTGPEANRTAYSLVLSRDITDRLTYVFENGDGWQLHGAPAGNVSTWYGIDQYLIYKVNCCWTAAMRFEWFRDNNGTRVAPVGDFQGGNDASAGGFAGNFCDITAGLQYKPNGNLSVRPEVRYDTYNGHEPNGDPFDAGTKNHQWLSSVDVIYQY